MFSGMQGLKLLLAPVMWRFFERTVKIETYTPTVDNIDQPIIFVSLHRDLIPAIMYLKPTKLAIVVSNSPDGDILVHTLGTENYNFIRGASGKDGGRAFVGMRRMLESDVSVGIAVDGPEGPFGNIHDGAFRLARLTGYPILPVKADPGRALRLGSWDRTVVPFPFTDVKMVCGNSFTIGSATEDFREYHQLLENFFQVGEKQP